METNLSDREHLEYFLDGVEKREDWLTVVKFGLPTLLGQQIFLVQLIARRAVKEAGGQNVVGYFAGIFEDLNLKLTNGE